MSKVAEALYEHDETFAELADVLFGEGATELVSKMNPTGSDLSTAQKRKKFERRQAQVGLASNVVGIGAGVAGLKDALKSPALKAKKGQMVRLKPIKVTGKTKALAAGAVGLQVANLVGDAVANRVLARGAKDPKKKVSKADKAGVLVSLGYNAAANADKGVKSAVEAKKLKAKAKKHIHKSEDVDLKFVGTLSKLDSDKRQVFGWASVTEVNGEPVLDRQGDYIAIEEIEKSAYTYVHKSRKGGDMHERDGELPMHKSDMIESFVVTPEKLEKMGLPADAMPHGWWVGYQVNDEDLWQGVKNGQRVMFSIHGKGVRTPMEA